MVVTKQSVVLCYVAGQAGPRPDNISVYLQWCLYPLVLKSALSKNFLEASVDVVDCPDLLQKPWSLAAPGKAPQRVGLPVTIGISKIFTRYPVHDHVVLRSSKLAYASG